MNTNQHTLPTDFEKEILPYVSFSEPTPKEKLIERIKERAWMKGNVKSVLNFLYSIQATLFFRDDDDRIKFA